MQTKSIFVSKTAIAAAITVGISFLGWLVGQEFIATNPQWVAIAGMIVGVLQVVLRFLTSQPVSWTGSRIERPYSLAIIPLISVAVLFGSQPSMLVAQDQAITSAGQMTAVQVASDNFHRGVIKAAAKAVRDGKLKRGDLVRLRVAMMSPAFREKALDLAVIQMSASGADGVSFGEDGLVDRGSINWEGLAAFLEKLLPLILQLIQAFGSIDQVNVFVDSSGQPCGAEIVCGDWVIVV